MPVNWEMVLSVFPLAVSVIVPVGPAPTLPVVTVTVSVVEAEEGMEAADAAPETLVPACTTVKGTATLLFAL
jgi:hypothetical protein